MDNADWLTDESQWTTIITNFSPENTLYPSYIDTTFADVEYGNYVWIVKSVYTSNNYSAPLASSNSIAKNPKFLHYIGDPNGTPYNNSNIVTVTSNSGVTQTLYYQDEINRSGKINGIMVTFSSAGLTSPDDIYSFWLAHTEKKVFLTEYDWVPYSEFQHVFTGTIPMLTMYGVNDIFVDFTEPFEYQSGNLVLMGHKTFGSDVNSWSMFICTQTPGIGRSIVSLTLREDLNPPFHNYPVANWVHHSFGNAGFVFETNNTGHITGNALIRSGDLRSPSRTGDLRSPSRTGDLRSSSRTGDLRSPSRTGDLRSPHRTNGVSPLISFAGETPSVQKNGDRRSPLRGGERRSPVRDSDIEIRLLDTSFVTYPDSNGDFSFTYVPIGTYDLVATKKGFYPFIETGVVIEDQQTTSVNIQMQQLPNATLSGTVISSGNNQGISGAVVTLNGYEDYEILTDSNGHFSIPMLYSGFSYSFNIRKQGYARYFDPVYEAGFSDTNLGNIILLEIETPPRDVQAEVNQSEAIITWREPLRGESMWLTQMGSGEYFESFGSQGGGAFHAIALHRYTQEQLNNLGAVDGEITSISFHISNNNANVSLAVYAGGTVNPLAPGTRVVNQPVTGITAGTFNQFALTTPYKIPKTGDIWIGYEINFLGGGYPLSVDSGPQNTLLGDIFYWGNNSQWFNLGLDDPFNFMIRAHIEGGLGSIRLAKNNNEFPTYNLYLSNILSIDNEETWTTIGVNLTNLTYTDTSWSVVPMGDYRYIVKAVYSGENALSEPAFSNIVVSDYVVDDADMPDIPLITTLKGNYPNPFNPSTTIYFDIANDDNVKIEIYNLRGQKVGVVFDDFATAGKYNVEWKGVDEYGRNIASGVYFYQMKTSDYTSIKRMLLMK